MSYMTLHKTEMTKYYSIYEVPCIQDKSEEDFQRGVFHQCLADFDKRMYELIRGVSKQFKVKFQNHRVDSESVTTKCLQLQVELFRIAQLVSVSLVLIYDLQLK